MRRLHNTIAGVACAAAAVVPAAASGQIVEAPFTDAYTVQDLGHPPDVPDRLGGLTFLAGSSDTILIGGEANASTGALYAVPVTRDADGHITALGAATRYADAAYNDGGVDYGPGGVLFLARYPTNELGQTKPGSTITDKIIPMGALGVASTLVGVTFVPPGFPGAGSLKLSSYSGGQWYDAGVAPDANGTYDVVNVTPVPGSQLGGGSDGFVYVPTGSRLFDAPSMLVSEYSAGMVAAYELDADGNPTTATRRTFISGLSGVVGAAIDPVSNDFLFSTFGGGSHVVAVRGFGSSQQEPVPEPVLGKSVSASVVEGEVLIKKGNAFVPLSEARSIPVRSILDTTRGTVKLSSARDKSGKTQSGEFAAGVFQVLQSRKRKEKGLTELRLKGSAAKFSSCPSGKADANSAGSRRRTVRRLRGRAKGRYRTRGKHSAATVRGTIWTVTDRCDGTMTRVRRGKVTVRDFRLHKTIVLKRGKRYLARAPG